LNAGGQDRPLDSYAVNSGAPEQPIAGRLIDKGLHDELTGTAYAVIDGTDGRTHHVRFARIEALEQAPAIGGIVELRAIGRTGEEASTLILANAFRSRSCRADQGAGATWLDHRLIERGAGIADGGFGAEVRRAMDQRTDHLVRDGLARKIRPGRYSSADLIETLTQARAGRGWRRKSRARPGLPIGLPGPARRSPASCASASRSPPAASP
jgi:hypothetical protein